MPGKGEYKQPISPEEAVKFYEKCLEQRRIAMQKYREKKKELDPTYQDRIRTQKQEYRRRLREQIPPELRRGPGRPRKEPDPPVDPSVLPPKRPRGRPRKEAPPSRA
jgi:hypothetical protein